VVGFGCMEVIIVAVVLLFGFAITLRVFGFKRGAKRESEDDADW
jgi:hypothetical protein